MNNLIGQMQFVKPFPLFPAIFRQKKAIVI